MSKSNHLKGDPHFPFVCQQKSKNNSAYISADPDISYEKTNKPKRRRNQNHREKISSLFDNNVPAGIQQNRSFPHRDHGVLLFHHHHH
jgi:hypothetical protein